MENNKLKNIIIILDLSFAIFTIFYLMYNLMPFFYILRGMIYDGGFNLSSANVFGILFVIMLFKLLLGIILFIYKKKYKENILEINNKYYFFVWLLFAILIITFSIVLIILKAINSNYNLIYSIYIIIGTYCWLKIILNNNNNISKILEKMVLTGNILCNIILIIIGYFISIY